MYCHFQIDKQKILRRLETNQRRRGTWKRKTFKL